MPEVIKRRIAPGEVRAQEISRISPLLNENDERVRGEWEYERGLIARITPTHKMTADEARAFTLQFGQCPRCGRHLKAAESVERGIGPICRTYFGL